MDRVIDFFLNRGRRMLIFSILIGLVYLMKDFLNMFLITFILTYLMYRLQKVIVHNINKVVKIDYRIVVIVLYVAFISGITLVLIKYLPVIIDQGIGITKQILLFYQQPHDDKVINFIIDNTKKFNITSYITKWADYVFKYATDVSKWGFNILVSLILSLIFLLEKNQIMEFTSKFSKSKISNFYAEIEYFCGKFIRSFGKVIEVQILIALINSILSIIALVAIGFPEILGFSIMIFIFGLIPVAGVFVSLIPLSLTAYTIGGITKVIYVIIVIAILHAIEGYILNPKLMSSKTDLPVFYTFLILILSEHFFGIWGLIIGIPIFMFILDLLEVPME